MNGARTTYMRRGYLLTALAAAVLLAASPGTASAQITATVANVTEGNNATITVTAKVRYPATTAVAAGAITVTAVPGTAESDADNSYEAADISLNPASVALRYASRADTATGTKDETLSGTITVATIEDPDAEDEKVSFTFTIAGEGSLTQQDAAGTALAAPTLSAPLTIMDDEVQRYVLTVTTDDDMLKEGEQVALSLRAAPAHEDNSTALTVALNREAEAAEYSVALAQSDGTAIEGSQVVIGATTTTPPGVGNSANVTITTPPNDKNRVEDTITLTVHSGQAGRGKLEDSEDITLADKHVLPAVKAMVTDKDGKVLDPQPGSVEEGKSVHIAVMPVDKDGKAIPAAEDLEVELRPSGEANAQDYRLAMSTIEIENGSASSSAVMLTAETDEDVGMETLMFNATVSGDKDNGTETSESMNILSLGIDDATQKKIWPLSQDEAYPEIQAAIEDGGGDEGLNPGESFEVMTDDLFGVMDGYTASYGVSVEGGAVSASASGDSVTVMAEEDGDAKVTVTGTARMASSSFQAEQTVSNTASITFPVTVKDKALVVTLEAPMNMNIVEGKSYDIDVTANRPVSEDTMVMFMRDRAASDADEDDYSIEDVTIMAGEHTAMATLMVTEDMADDAGHAMGEALVLYAEVDGEETNSLMFTIWDMAVPALPLIGQLVLALFLALGGARLYRRRQG